MKLPKKINIKGQDYTIIRVKDLVNEDGEALEGACCGVFKTIELCKTLKGGDLKSTFIHECLHAVMIECKLGELISSRGEETIVGNMEYFLMDKFRMNLK